METDKFICPSCGSVMKFNIKQQKMMCSSCGAEGDLQPQSDEVCENDFSQYAAREKESVPYEGMETAVCQNCGLEISFDPKQISATCPMCGSTQVSTAKQKAGIPPEGVVPFKIEKPDAQQKFRQWVKSRWFAPNDFKNKYGEGDLKGMYLPFWTFDAHAVSRYSGQGGKIRKVKGDDGKEKEETDWYNVSGTVASDFDDIQICASEKDEKIIGGILPYDTAHSIKPFTPAYLSGYYAELYSIRADKSFVTAKTLMDEKMTSLAKDDIRRSYDTCRDVTVISQFSNVTYKHVLLPLWASAFGYGGNTYRYLVNGETGKVSGQRPYSAVKIAAAIIAAIAVTIMIFIAMGSGDEESAELYNRYYICEEIHMENSVCQDAALDRDYSSLLI